MKPFPWYPVLAWLLVFSAVYAFFWALTTPPNRSAAPPARIDQLPAAMPGASSPSPAGSAPSAPQRRRPVLMV